MILIISGPQGVGKTTIVNEFLKKNKNFQLSVSSTTRNLRDKEQENVEYNFLSKDKFQELEKQNYATRSNKIPIYRVYFFRRKFKINHSMSFVNGQMIMTSCAMV